MTHADESHAELFRRVALRLNQQAMAMAEQLPKLHPEFSRIDVAHAFLASASMVLVAAYESREMAAAMLRQTADGIEAGRQPLNG